MSHMYWLPDEQGHKQEFETESNAIIIIGANGAGKSKLGAWIERQSLKTVHRIGAQRKLNFEKDIQQTSFSKAENAVRFGTDRESPTDKGRRWGYDESSFTTKMIDDFDNVLSALLAKDNNDKSVYFKQCQEAEKAGVIKPAVPTTIFDSLLNVWNRVLPTRSLFLDDSKLYTRFQKDNAIITYSATNMSDGERSVLYLAAQVLCVPDNNILIIDEPELHLHKSIMTRLWGALEQQRPDCLFIYITHDTQFAAEHTSAVKIWIKEYNGHTWTMQKVEDDLPEALLLDILGSRKNVLFVEGERDSFDTKLYSELYPNYHVVPCGSCSQVIARTKAFHSNLTLHDCSVYGIIDRDFRSEYEIAAYRSDNIYTIDVAEVENLFIVEELVRLIAEHMGKDTDAVFSAVKKYVVEERFSNEINRQICESVVSEIKYKLACAEISKKNDNEAKASLQAALDSIDFDAIRQEREAAFQSVLRDSDYKEVIRVFNQKSISKSIGRFFDIANSAYCEVVIALLRGNKHKEIIAAIKPYLPTEIPLEDNEHGT